MTTGGNSTVLPRIGAIRWDAWYDGQGGLIQQFVQASLTPSQFAYRRPSFSTIDNNGNLVIDGNYQNEMTFEITQAHASGINYWAFDYYASGNPLQNALDSYLINPSKFLVNFCLIDGPTWNAEAGGYEAALMARARLMADPSYECIGGCRPLYYVMINNDGSTTAAATSDLKTDFAYLRSALKALNGENPYIVIMGRAGDASLVASTGADALSAYATADDAAGNSVQTLQSEAIAAWNQLKSTDVPVIPTVTTGFDVTPRVTNPFILSGQVPGDGQQSFATASPSEVASSVVAAIDWSQANPNATLNNILVYAWNEFDEGGYIAPTYIPGSPAGDTSRLDAISVALSAQRSYVTSLSVGGNIIDLLPDGSSKVFSSSGVLTKTISSDGSFETYSPDGTQSEFDQTGHLLREFYPDGTWNDFKPDGTIYSYGKTPSNLFTLKSITQPDGSAKLFGFDGIVYILDTSGKKIETLLPDNSVILIGKDGSSTHIDSLGRIQEIVAHDGSSQLKYVDGWLDYSPAGAYLQHESVAADGSTSLYGPTGGLTQINMPDGTKVEIASDGTQSFYDAAGSLLKVVALDGSSQLKYVDGWLDYSPAGAYLQHESVAADGSTSLYGPTGGLTQINMPDGTKVEIASDGTQSFYDAAGSVLKVVALDGSSQLKYVDGWLDYSPAGAYLQHESVAADGSTSLYGPTGGLTQINMPDGTKVEIASDGTQSFYDAAGSLLKVVALDGSSQLKYVDGWLDYSPAGAYLQHESVAADGSTSLYGPTGGLTQINMPDGTKVEIASDGTQSFYDAAGSLLKVVALDGSSQLKYVDGWLDYSPAGAYLQHESVAADGSTSLYGPTGGLTQINMPDGTKVEIAGDGTQSFYDAAGSLLKVVALDGSSQLKYVDGWLDYSPAGAYLQHESVAADGSTSLYGPTGGLTQINMPDGTKVEIASDGTQSFYDAAGSLLKVVALDGSSQLKYVDGWLDYSPAGAYLQHESVAADGSTSLYGPTGGLTQINMPDGTKVVIGTSSSTELASKSLTDNGLQIIGNIDVSTTSTTTMKFLLQTDALPYCIQAQSLNFLFADPLQSDGKLWSFDGLQTTGPISDLLIPTQHLMLTSIYPTS